MDPKNPPPRISAAGLLGPDFVYTIVVPFFIVRSMESVDGHDYGNESSGDEGESAWSSLITNLSSILKGLSLIVSEPLRLLKPPRVTRHT